MADFSSVNLEKIDQVSLNQKTVYKQDYSVKTVFDAENRALCFTVVVLENTIGMLNLQIQGTIRARHKLRVYLDLCEYRVRR